MAATASMAGRVLPTATASQPSSGPPAIWPRASAWLFMEWTVARTSEARPRLIQALAIGCATRRTMRVTR